MLLAAVGVDLLFCEVVGAAAGDNEGAPADPGCVRRWNGGFGRRGTRMI